MKAPRDLFTNSCAAVEGPGKVFDEPSPPFQLTRQFAPPRTAVVSVKKIQPHPAMISRGLLPTAVQYELFRGCTDKLFGEPLYVTDEGTGHSRSSIYNAIKKRGVPGQRTAAGPVRRMAPERPGIVAETAN